MSARIRTVVLTSTFCRHQFVVNRITERLDVVGVWQEEKSFAPLRYAESDEDERVIGAHFDARDASEAKWFAEHDAIQLTSEQVHRVSPNGCNAPDVVTAIRALEPDIVLVFGTGILRGNFIDAFEGRIINLHLGLSPYYRGAGTNFWPLVNREPEYVGATIHYLDAGIDTGPMIAHVRPEIRESDGPHDVGNRTIEAAADCLADVALAHVAGKVRAVPQPGGGRLYRRKDFSAAAVRQLYRNFESGMLGEYLANKTARDVALKLLKIPLTY